MTKIAIIGNGGFAREIAPTLDNYTFFIPDIEYKAILDNTKSNIYNTKPMSQLTLDYHVIIAIGSPTIRKKIVEQELSPDTKYYTYIHKSVQLLDPDTIKIGRGSIICAGSILTTNIEIGDFSQIHLNCTIGHDTIIGSYFTATPGVNIAGCCKIGNLVYVGTNSSIRDKSTICDNTTLGLNTGVVKDIIEPGTYVGSPNKLISK